MTVTSVARAGRPARGAAAAPDTGPATSAAVTAVSVERSLALMDDHGDDLLNVARLVTGTDAAARRIVALTLLDADDVTEVPRTSLGTRKTLAARIVTTWIRIGDRSQPSGWRNESIDSLARIRAQQQHSALALYLYGSHTPRAIGAVLHLPQPTVRQHLRAAMGDLST